jgi:hypothetical protein
MRLFTLLFALLFAVTLAGQPTTSASTPQRRGIALLIGNINYPEDPLNSVREDLGGMRPALEELGFETDVRTNLDRPEDFRAALSDFLRQKKADANDIVLVLYSGHGLQLEGSTYLLGTNYHTVTEAHDAALAHAFSADDLVKDLEQAPPYARILIIDACRINALSAQGQKGGVALRQNYDNTVVLFSNEPGKTVPARAATSLRSPFIESLIYALKTSTNGIKEVFETTKKATMELSPGQIPQMLTSSNYESALLSVQTARAPSHRAAELVNQAKTLYTDRSWKEYLEVFQTAKPFASDSDLLSRINRESAWVKQVEDAEAAAAAAKNACAEEAGDWDRASELFPARIWTTERSALAKLKCDQEEEAMPLLVRLSLVGDEGTASRARLMIASLTKSDPQLADLVKKSSPDAPPVGGSEFELVEVKQ